MTLTEMANGLSNGNREQRVPTPSEQREMRRPLTIERQGDVLVITVDCSAAAIERARTTNNGNKLLASTMDDPDSNRGWIDVGNGVGLNLAVTHREHEPARHRTYDERYTYRRRRPYRNDYRRDY